MDASDRRKRVSEEAAAWRLRLQSKGLAREVREEFVDWLRESPIHVAEMLRIAKVHDALDQFKSWVEINTDGSDDGDQNVVDIVPSLPTTLPAPALRGPPKHPKRLWMTLIAAASAAIAISGAFLSARGQTIETHRGERLEVALSDGSVLDVDPETRIQVAFEQHARKVILQRGRALFHVAKNPARPFLVQSDGTVVRAVGTAFAVEQQTQGVLVTVAEGKVDVYFADMPHGTSPAPAERHDTPDNTVGAKPPSTQFVKFKDIFLTAGQQVSLGDSGSASPVRLVDTKRALAWAAGRLVFDNESIADAAAEFNRYNQIQLKVIDAELAARPVSGVFNASDPESFIAFLQNVTSVQIKRSGGEIILQ